MSCPTVRQRDGAAAATAGEAWTLRSAVPLAQSDAVRVALPDLQVRRRVGAGGEEGGVPGEVLLDRNADPLDPHSPRAGRLDQSMVCVGDDRVVVVRGAQDLGKDVAAELTGFAADLPEEIVLVVVHAGGAKGKALLTALLAAGAEKVECPKLTKHSERRDFVRRELRAPGRSVDDEAIGVLLEAVGTDLRELAAACSQLLAAK